MKIKKAFYIDWLVEIIFPFIEILLIVIFIDLVSDGEVGESESRLTNPASQDLFWVAIGFYLFFRFMNLWKRYDKKRAIKHLEDRISNLEKRNEMREMLEENKN